MYEQALVDKEEAFGPEHLSILSTVNNLSKFYANLGWFGEAERLYRRVLDGYET